MGITALLGRFYISQDLFEKESMQRDWAWEDLSRALGGASRAGTALLQMIAAGIATDETKKKPIGINVSVVGAIKNQRGIK